ncbi:MAG: 4-hydroxyphenylpyruvate dioxygenase, partial [Candidatus Dormibacteria bacterium]
DILGGRVEVIDEELEQLRQINLLVDRDEQGDVMQTFISSVEARLTLYFEVIQRKGSSDFGKGNFRALFRPIEQGVRGNL